MALCLLTADIARRLSEFMPQAHLLIVLDMVLPVTVLCPVVLGRLLQGRGFLFFPLQPQPAPPLGEVHCPMPIRCMGSPRCSSTSPPSSSTTARQQSDEYVSSTGAPTHTLGGSSRSSYRHDEVSGSVITGSIGIIDISTDDELGEHCFDNNLGTSARGPELAEVQGETEEGLKGQRKEVVAARLEGAARMGRRVDAWTERRRARLILMKPRWPTASGGWRMRTVEMG